MQYRATYPDSSNWSLILKLIQKQDIAGLENCAKCACHCADCACLCTCLYCVIEVERCGVLIKDPTGKLFLKRPYDHLILQSRDTPQDVSETHRLESWRKAVIHNFHNQSAFETMRILFGNLFVHAKVAWYNRLIFLSAFCSRRTGQDVRAGGIVALLCLGAFCCGRMRK